MHHEWARLAAAASRNTSNRGMARIITHIRSAVDQNVQVPLQGPAGHTDANRLDRGVCPGNHSTK